MMRKMASLDTEKFKDMDDKDREKCTSFHHVKSMLSATIVSV